MVLLRQILPAVVLAATVGAAVSSLAFLCRKDRVQRSIIPLATGLAYVSGHLFVTGWVMFPPADTTNWLPYFALGAAGLRVLFGLVILPVSARVLLHGVISVAALRLLLAPKFRSGWPLGEGWMWVASLGLGIVLISMILDVLSRGSFTAGEFPAFLLIICAGASGALMLSGSMLLGQFAAVLAGGVLGTLLFTLQKPEVGGGITHAFSLLFAALLLCGYFFAELPITSAVLLATAPALALIPIRKTSPAWISAFRAALISIPTTAALIFAFRASPPLDY